MAASLRVCALALLVILFAPSGAGAQDYPSRTVKIIVPFGAGGPADVYARQLAQHMGDSLKQTFVVENMPGAGSVIGPLAQGVPVLVIPGGADQLENAEQVCVRGVGRQLVPADASADAVREHVEAMLDDDTITRATVELRDEIAAMPSPREVVSALERLAAR